MGSSPTNAAVRWMVAAHGLLNEVDDPPSDYPFTDDFVAVDKRGNPLWPRLGKNGYASAVGEWWQSGRPSPRFEVEAIAVRGDRYAALRHTVDVDGMGMEMIVAVALDSTLRLLERVVAFDAGAPEDAIRLLGEWNEELEP